MSAELEKAKSYANKAEVLMGTAYSQRHALANFHVLEALLASVKALIRDVEQGPPADAIGSVIKIGGTD